MRAVLIQLAVRQEETAVQRERRVCGMLEQMERRGERVDLLLLPELWKVGFSNFEEYPHEAEPLSGSTMQLCSRWAKRLQCTMAAGSFLEAADNGTVCNAIALVGPDGTCRAVYRKIHLFGYQSREREFLRAGRETVVCDTPAGRIGLATCYDLRFPEQFRAMMEDGAQIVCVTAAWPRERLEDWRLFCRVRALENQCFVLACNHAGQHGGVTGAGHSMVVAPDGTVLAEAGEQEEQLSVSLDIDSVAQERDHFPALHDRVPL